MKFIRYIIDTTILGFTFICKLLSRGFYFYFYAFMSIFTSIFKKSKFLHSVREHFKLRQEQPVYFLLTSFLILFCSTGFILINDKREMQVDKSDTTNIVSDNHEVNPMMVTNNKSDKINLFKKYESIPLEQVDFNSLSGVNSDVVSWLYVNGTNINYPVLQTSDNEFYLKNNILKEKTTEGWPFMDYRNSKMMSDNNTIFYGHNLLNKTNFGSMANIFTKDWFKSSSHEIIVLNRNKKYTYKIFTCYITGNEVDYLQNNFYDSVEYDNFLKKIKKKSKFDFNVDVSSSDNIITLSTCTDDNKGRKVVHAKLIGTESI